MSFLKILAGLVIACFWVSQIHASTQMYFIHNDHLGTPQVVTDQSQMVVWEGQQKPFGEVEETTASIEQLSRFPGQYFDEESNLHYNYFRDYDPTLGRYIQSDPIGLRGGINTYAYVGGNPLMYTDPTGENPAAALRGGFALGGAFVRTPAGQRTIGWLVDVAWNITHDDADDWESPVDDIGPDPLDIPSDDADTKDSQEEYCREKCSNEALPSGDNGFRYWNCFNRCMEEEWCE